MKCPSCGASLTGDLCTNCGYNIKSAGRRDRCENIMALTGPLPINTTIGPDRRYIIEKEIGSGGMGRTYMALDGVLTKRCVIKEFDPDLCNLPTHALPNAKRGFEAEASILASLRHSNMPSVWDYFEAYGRAYFAVDLIEGKNLEELADKLTKPLDERQLIDIGIAVCEVLEYVHIQNPPIIHRDIKPQNIMRSSSDKIYLIDFGAARNYKPGRRDTIAFGTKGFAAPEAENQQSETRSDIYSLGMTLFTLSTATTPDKYVTGSFPLANVVNPKVSVGLSKVIAKAIEMIPSQRFDAREMRQRLLALRNDTKVCRWCGSHSAPLTGTCDRCGGDLDELPGFTWEGIRGDRTNRGYRPYNIRPVGRIKWCAEGLGEIRSSPLVSEDYIILPIATGSELRCFDVSSGKCVWSLKLTSPVAKTGYVVGGYGYFPLVNGSIIQVNLAQGRLMHTIWEGNGFAATMALSASTEQVAHISGKQLVVANPRSKQTSYTYTHECDIKTSATFYQESIIIGDANGRISRINKDGLRQWQSRPRGDAITGAIPVDRDWLFYSTQNGYVGCMDMNGGFIWGTPLSERIVFAPCVAGDLVVTGAGQKGLTALSANSGEVKWNNTAIKAVVCPPLICGDTIIAFDYLDGYGAIFRENGTLVKKFEAKPKIVFPPAMYRGFLIAVSSEGQLIVVE